MVQMSFSDVRLSLMRWLAAMIDFRRLRAMRYMPRYWKHWRQYRARSAEVLRIADGYPCLSDWVAATPFDPHYFFQAAWLARRLAASSPARHVDIGSDIRMVNVLSAFVPMEFLDYRPLDVALSGLQCFADDLLALSRADASIGSLSCLHVIEHVGLGRYGDSIDPQGSRKAALELARVLAPSGRLYVSMPVGRERVCFNAHRVFAPAGVPGLFPQLNLESFSFVDDAGVFHEDALPNAAEDNEYACGMYVFSRPA